jgi:glyceraldehyde-3-phosphate dehydrogenase/erythrose-4-phosphate dehydrogenase
MTTVHASTRSQHVLDGYSKRGRCAGKTNPDENFSVD